jgi:hypothetical protein
MRTNVYPARSPLNTKPSRWNEKLIAELAEDTARRRGAEGTSDCITLKLLGLFLRKPKMNATPKRFIPSACLRHRRGKRPGRWPDTETFGRCIAFAVLRPSQRSESH